MEIKKVILGVIYTTCWKTQKDDMEKIAEAIRMACMCKICVIELGIMSNDCYWNFVTSYIKK